MVVVEFVAPRILRIPFERRIHRAHNHLRMEPDSRQHDHQAHMDHRMSLRIVEPSLEVRSFDKGSDHMMDFPVPANIMKEEKF